MTTALHELYLAICANEGVPFEWAVAHGPRFERLWRTASAVDMVCVAACARDRRPLLDAAYARVVAAYDAAGWDKPSVAALFAALARWRAGEGGLDDVLSWGRVVEDLPANMGDNPHRQIALAAFGLVEIVIKASTQQNPYYIAAAVWDCLDYLSKAGRDDALSPTLRAHLRCPTLSELVELHNPEAR